MNWIHLHHWVNYYYLTLNVVADDYVGGHDENEGRRDVDMVVDVAVAVVADGAAAAAAAGVAGVDDSFLPIEGEDFADYVTGCGGGGGAAAAVDDYDYVDDDCYYYYYYY